MVTAGFPATVAPLGTALTEDQLALLWKMADEPILCFDGDAAGRRASYRAIDIALPLLKPGKSLLFATLPEGQDPDDLVRSGGRAAVAEVIAGARPLAEVLWMRECEAGRFDTPERRAGLEARIAAVTSGIGHDSVRKYYRQDLELRLRRLFAPSAPIPDRDRALRHPRRGGRETGYGRRFGPDRSMGERLAPLSPRFPTSPIVRGSRSALPAREALILLAMVNHPWLLGSHAEELAEIEFLNPDADLLRRAILDSGHEGLDPQALRAAVAVRNLESVLARVEKAITHASDWPARTGAAKEDVAQWWSHIVTLHRKTRTLHKELKDAERALGEEPTEENLAWLRDVQGRLSALEGTEALIEGFGASSGRAASGL